MSFFLRVYRKFLTFLPVKNHDIFCLRSIATSGNTQIVPVDLAHTSYSSDSEKDVVIIHGLLGSRNNWNSIAKALKKDTKYNIHSVDARNHGQSPHTPEMTYYHLAADLSKFIKERNSSATVIGHSMGGRAAMLLALTQPECIERLVVVDISPVRNPRDISQMGAYLQALSSLKIPNGTPLSEARKIGHKHLSKLIEDESIRQFLLTNLNTSKSGDIGWNANLPSLEANLAEHIVKFPSLPDDIVFAKPTLFLVGKKSPYVLPDDVPEIQKIFPNSTFVFLEGAGHWVHADQPALFIENVVKFIKSGS